jgi:hypothetical protein
MENSLLHIFRCCLLKKEALESGSSKTDQETDQDHKQPEAVEFDVE